MATYKSIVLKRRLMNTPPKSQEVNKRSLMSLETIIAFAIAGLLFMGYIIRGVFGDGFSHYILGGAILSFIVGMYYKKKPSTPSR